MHKIWKMRRMHKCRGKRTPERTILQWMWKYHHLRNKTEDVVMDALLYGTGLMKVGWDAEGLRTEVVPSRSWAMGVNATVY